MKLLLADDHTLFRDALVQYIGRAEPESIVLIAKNLDDVFDILEKETRSPDLILLDLRMPGMNGLEGLGRLRKAYPDIAVAMLSGVAEQADVNQAMEMGAMGYFPKTLSGSALMKAIQLVLEGERFLPIERETNDVMPSYYADTVAGAARPQGADGTVNGTRKGAGLLTAREKEVLSYLAGGLSNKEIARAIDLQVVTVKLHVRGICRKLGAKNRTQAALKAREIGILPQSE